jgi:arylsulfatase A-like enzyme
MRYRKRALARTLACVMLLGASACQPSRPDIVLVVLDTVRRDFTGVGGASKGATPRLDDLMAQGTAFRNAWANAPWTVPSHASLFTGLLPSEHGCNAVSPHLDPKHPTLAAALADAGYDTGAFFSNPWLSDRTTGLLRSFEERREAEGRPLAGAHRGDQGGRETLREVRDWLSKRSEQRPFFLFVNFLEAHLPYDPPLRYRKRELRDLGADDLLSIEWAQRFNAGLRPAADVDWERVRRLYAGDVWTADRLLGALQRALGSLRRERERVVIVTSDHGENLGDHGLVEHQFGVFESLLAVLLVIHAPERLPPGVRDDPVMLSDLFATLLDLAGVDDLAPRRRSRSLLGAPGAADRALFAEYAGGPPPLVALLRRLNPRLDPAPLEVAYATVRRGNDRFTLGSDGSRRLHAVRADPGQQHDLAGQDDERASQLERLLLERGLAPRRGAEHTPAALDAGVRARLRALGYLP